MAGRAPKRKPRSKSGPAAAEHELVKMSELAKRSGVPSPTIKHYIREGLLPGPEVRTSRNMAYYDARIADRTRAIKQLQGERFLPLRVIGDLLEPSPSAAIRPAAEAQHRAQLARLAPVVGARLETRTGESRRKRSEVEKTLGVRRAELDQLEAAGVLELRGSGDAAGYAGVDLELLDILGDFHRLGLADVFPLAIAAPYLRAVRELARVEVDLFRMHAIAAPPGALRQPLPEIARHAAELGERLIRALRAKILPGMLQSGLT